MRLPRIPATLTCLMLTLAVCTDDSQDDAADEIGTESTTESGTESTTESGTGSTTESGSTDTSETTTETTETTDTGDTTDTSTTDTSTTDTSTTDTSTTDTGLGSCEDIPSTYEALVANNTGCDVDADCHVVDGHCWMGLGGCWYVVNLNLKQSDLDDLADAFQGCPPPFICACIPPPANVGCVDGTCSAL